MRHMNHHGEPVQMVSIPADEYGEMQERLAWLDCLEAAGVDNWCGIDVAHDMAEEQGIFED